MRLRRLDILGFKSFRPRTAVEIGDGVTAIVGPNGCGKSNIVDAIRWALGAQNARDLRGRDMADVIFAGSESHPPMGFAEVSLVFENDRLDLPLPWRDVPEIRVTRRLHRTGESEYEINGAASRLRDLTELFLGTGVGSREAYSIIEQGKVGFIVQARPEERRVLIEEAAGITRYRYQRRTAERRLESTRANLTRLQDILGEVARQLASLERQAVRAQRWRELAGRRRALELTALVERHQKLADELTALQARTRGQEDARAGAAAALARLEAQHESARVEWFVVEKRLTAASEAAYGARSRAEILSNNLGHLRREAADLSGRIERTQRDRDEQMRLAERAAGESGTLDLELAALVAEEASLAVDLRSSEDLLRGTREKRAAASEAARQAASEATRIRGELAGLRARLESLRSEHQRLAARAEDADRSLGTELQDETSFRAAWELAQTEATTKRAFASAADATLASARADEVAARERLQSAQRDERDALQSRAVAATRVGALEQSIASGAGYAAGPRQMLAAAGRGELSGILRPIVERLRVDSGSEALVAAALGPWVDAILVADEACARAAGAWARARKLSVRMLVLESPELGELLPGCAAVESVPRVVAQKLRATAVTEDVLSAEWLPGTQLVDRHRGAVEAGAALVVAAEAAGSAEQIFALTRDLEAARIVLGEADERVRAAMGVRVAADGALEAALLRREEAREAFEQARTAAASAQSDAEAAAGRLRAAEATVLRLRADAAHVEARRGVVAAEIGTIEASIGQLAGGEATVGLRLQELSEQAAVEERAEATVADRVATLRAGHAAAFERLRALRQSLERTRGTAFAARERVRKLGDELQQLGASQARIAQDIERDVAASAQADAARAATDVETEAARRAHDEASATLRDIEANVALARTRLNEVVSAGRDVELRAERASAAMQAAEQAISDRFQISLAAARAEALPGGMTPELHTELGDVVDKLDRLGPVNPNADEEFSEAQQRHAFLEAQRADLETAMADLEAAIRKMDETSRELFAQTYEEVNARFQELFPRLFRGGRARLELTQPDDLLETGIEIVCQPPGKRLQSMTLMSGGEKALSAVALIFAIFQMKPTPFCILDEVDAPLDEGNVVRFSEMVREMSSGSQFLLITHNKRTMEVARTLYGVTMEEPGVSKIVGVRLHGRDDGEGRAT